MKKVLRSTFGTLAVAAFLAIAPPTYARGGHGGHGGHAVKGHAAAGHVRGGHAGFRARGARGPYVRHMDILEWAITAWAMAIHTTGLAITVIATVGTIRTTGIGDTTLPLRILAVREFL